MSKGLNTKWPSVPLGNILTERREKPSLHDILTGKIRIVSKISFDNGQIQLRSDSKTKTGMILIRPGDLVLSGINACKGAVAIYYENSREPITATIHYSAYIPHKDKVEIKFLWRLLRSEVFRNILNQHLPGGIKTELRAKRFLRTPIPLPPLLEQRRIVVRTEELVPKIEEVQELRRDAVEEAGAVIDSALEKIIKEGRKRKWNFVSFDSACDINPSKRDISYDDDLLVSFIPMSSVDGKSGKIVKHFVRPYQQVKKGYKWFVEGDVIFARITPCMENGKIAIAKDLNNGIGFGSTEFHVFRPKKNILSEWIHYLTRRSTFRKLAELSFKGTAGHQRVQIAFFYKQEIPLPPKEKQRHIVAYLDNLQEKTDSLKRLQLETQSELDALIPSILAKAFKGEL